MKTIGDALGMRWPAVVLFCACLMMLPGLGSAATSGLVKQFDELPTDSPSRGEVLWYDDLESGAPGWTHGDFTAVPPEFHTDTYMAYLGGTSWWCGNFDYDTDGGYGNSWDQSLVIPDIALSQFTSYPVLTFCYRVDSEIFYDRTDVQVEQGGLSTTLASYYGQIAWTDLGPAPGGFALSGADDPLQIRFRFTSDEAWSDEDGIYMSVGGAFMCDNIKVYDFTTGVTVFLDTVEPDSDDSCIPTVYKGGDHWHLGTSPCHASSGERYWACASVDTPGFVPAGVNNWLMTPLVDISEITPEMGLRFVHSQQFFVPGGMGDSWKEEYTVDGGATWHLSGHWWGDQYEYYGRGPCHMAGYYSTDASHLLPGTEAALRWTMLTDSNGCGPDAIGLAGIMLDDIRLETTGGENIVCDPDPLDLAVGSTSGTIDVNYLGGGGGLLYGYSMTVTWDVAKAALTGITEGNLLSDAGGTNFFVSGPDGTKTIDCALMGGATGASGPGTLFTLAFSAVGSGTSTIDLGLIAFRDSGNNPLSGFTEDDGLINVDVTSPVFTDVSLANPTLPDTDDYAKDTDNLQLTAAVTDDYSLSVGDIVADLSGLLSGGGTAVVPEDYTSGVATWTAALANVTLTADGAQTVTVTATDWLGNSASDSDGIIVDNTLPGTVAGFAAAPAHEEVDLSWDDPTGLDANYCGVMVRYDVWGDYPTYDLGTPVYPAVETDGLEAFSGDDTGTTHAIVPRDIHYYSVFVFDWALNYGTVVAAGQDRATNYWLGDVANAGNLWVPDGNVFVADITKLSTLYGSAPAGDELKCDVGPTDDHGRVGIPEPDDMLNFEDLMIFSMNYGVVAPRIVPFLGEPGVGDLALALAENGRTDGGVLELALRLEGNAGDVKGLTAELEFEGLEFLSARLSDEMSSPLADMFFWSNATSRSVQVDAAVLGTDATIGGSGDVVVFSFQVLDETYAVDFASATLRGAENEDLTAELEGLSSEGVPVAFKLVQNSPNPFNPVTKVAYHVPHESHVTIRVFDVTGRLVTTLVDGVVEPGRHSAVWNGTNEHGESVGSGVYFCTMETPDYRDSHKMTLLK